MRSVFLFLTNAFFICIGVMAESIATGAAATGAGTGCVAASVCVVEALLDVSQATVARLARRLKTNKYFFMSLFF